MRKFWSDTSNSQLTYKGDFFSNILMHREAVEEAGKLGDVLFWMRAGGIKSKHHQVMSWAGDQTVDWTKSDGLPSSIVAALSLAVSGNYLLI